MIPEITKSEWVDIIHEKINPELSSFSLKMKINSVRQHYKSGRMTLNEAVQDLYELCVKYEKIYTEDLKKIFNTNSVSL